MYVKVQAYIQQVQFQQDSYNLKMNIVFLCLAGFVWITQNCPANSFTVSRQRFICSLNFQAKGASCGEQQFTSCNISECIGTTQSCSPTAYTFKDSSACFAKCCQGYDQSLDIYSAAQICSSSASGSNTLLIVLIVTISVAIALFIIFTLCVIYRKYQKIHKVNISNNIASGQINPQISLQQIRINRHKLNAELGKVKPQNLVFQWKEKKGEEVSTHCTICLSDKSTLKLQCGHCYHPKCLREWLKRKRECGVCRSQRLMQMLLVCKKCKKKQTNLRYPEFKVMKELDVFCQECKSC